VQARRELSSGSLVPGSSGAGIWTRKSPLAQQC